VTEVAGKSDQAARKMVRHVRSKAPGLAARNGVLVPACSRSIFSRELIGEYADRAHADHHHLSKPGRFTQSAERSHCAPR
jgi:hypothetical protein